MHDDTHIQLWSKVHGGPKDIINRACLLAKPSHYRVRLLSSFLFPWMSRCLLVEREVHSRLEL